MPKKRANSTRPITPEHRAKMVENAAKARAARAEAGWDYGDTSDWESVYGCSGYTLHLPKGTEVRL